MKAKELMEKTTPELNEQIIYDNFIKKPLVEIQRNFILIFMTFIATFMILLIVSFY